MKEAQRKLADAMIPHIEINGAEMQWTQAGYDAALPETITAEQAAVLNAHHKACVPAVTVAFGDVGIPHLAANPNLSHVEGVAHIGTSKVVVHIEREGMRQVGIPEKGKEPERVATAGLTHVKITTSGGSALKQAREYVAQLGADKL